MNEALLKLLESETNTKVVREGLETKVTPAKDAKELWSEVREFAGEEGWLCLTDEVRKIDKTTDFDELQGRVILSGELAKGAQSLHIRQAQEGWSLIHLCAGEGRECLKWGESFISTEKNNGLRLNYDVYWSLQEGVYSPSAFRFVGFSEGGNTP